jgi:hypothetical protein
MKQITRTIATSTINVVKIEVKEGVVTGIPVDCVVVVGETLTEDKAKKFVDAKYGKAAVYAVSGVTVEEKEYSISLEDFLKAAKVVEPK